MPIDAKYVQDLFKKAGASDEDTTAFLSILGKDTVQIRISAQVSSQLLHDWPRDVFTVFGFVIFFFVLGILSFQPMAEEMD